MIQYYIVNSFSDPDYKQIQMKYQMKPLKMERRMRLLAPEWTDKNVEMRFRFPNTKGNGSQRAFVTWCEALYDKIQKASRGGSTDLMQKPVVLGSAADPEPGPM